MYEIHWLIREIAMIAAVVPIKNLSMAKSRLGDILSLDERKELVLAMLKDVLNALTGSALITDIFAVVDAEFKAPKGFETIIEPKNRGYNEAIIEAVSNKRIKSAKSMVVLPADLPLLQSVELDILVSGCLKKGLRIAPARDGDGTNAILMSPPNLMPTQFGVGSFFKHRKAAVNIISTVEIVNLPGLAFDVDTAQDLVDFCKNKSDTATYTFLKESGVLKRIINLEFV